MRTHGCPVSVALVLLIACGPALGEGAKEPAVREWEPIRAGNPPPNRHQLPHEQVAQHPHMTVVAAGFTGELTVVFWKALARHPADADPPNLVVELEAEDGRWGRAFGLAQHISKGLHEGAVTRAEVAGDTFRLHVSLILGADPWSSGGYAEYDVVATRDSRGALEGVFEGTYKGNKASGRVTGAVKPSRPVRAKDFKPLSPDEHPRVLFRTSDLPALREKLKTPFGQAYLAKAGTQKGLAPWDWDLVNIGVLYQLTGNTNYAASARLIVERTLKDPEAFVSDRGAGSGGWGHTLVATALALDLFWEAWPADFRKRIEDRLLEELPHLLRVVSVTSYPNMHPCSNYYGPGMGAPGLAALVLWGGRGPEPARPGDPLDRPRMLEPPADFVPGKGVPVVEFAPGRSPSDWLMAGPLAAFTSGDPLASVGGCGRARPEEGVPVEMFAMVDGTPKTAKSVFRPLARAEGGFGLDVEKLTGTNQPLTLVLFAALKVAATQDVGFVRNGSGVMVWLAGAEMNETDYYRLKPGLYPLTVVYSSDMPAGRVAPFLDLPASETLRPRRGRNELEAALWKMDRDYWTTTGGCDPKRDWMVWAARQRCYHHYRLGVGDGGYQAETGHAYAGIATWYPLNFAVAYRKMFGRDASPYPDITHLVPRRLMQVAFRETAASSKGNPNDTLSTFHANKRTLHQFVNSITGIENVPFDILAAGFPIVPDPCKPAVLWAWNKVQGVDPADPATAVGVLGSAGLGLALSFVHYPLAFAGGGAELKPEHPAKVMPLAWAADTFGHHTFRNGWRDENDFIAQVFLKASLIKAHNHGNAGTFALLGLGHGWVNGALGKGNPNRDFEPVVLLPLDETNEGGCGQLLHRAVQPDGSATISIDLNDVYASKKSRLYDSNLLRMPENKIPSGITGLRALAFDYSGKSGAPCLFAIVDKITGGQERWWQWTLDRKAFAVTKASNNTFTVDYGDASLKATFITPADAKPDVRAEEFMVAPATATAPAQRWPLNYVRAPGRDHFFVVGTIQRGDPPEVKIEGAGLNAQVTVGGQTIRFDGEKIVLGTPGASGRHSGV